MLDFRPGKDSVRRQGQQAVIVDSEGIYADVPVDGDVLTDEGRQRLDKLDRRQAAIMFEVVRTSPFLSPEGRQERLSYLLSTGKVRLTFQAV